MAAVGLYFFPSKDTLDCDKMKWSSRCCDPVQTTEKERHVTHPPAAQANIYHLSHAERWHLFILPGPGLRNQFHSNTRLPCHANGQYAAPSGTVQLYISALVMSHSWGMFLTSFLRSVDGVGERLRCHRHVDPAVWKRGEAVSPLLAWWGVWCLSHLWGNSERDTNKNTFLLLLVSCFTAMFYVL